MVEYVLFVKPVIPYQTSSSHNKVRLMIGKKFVINSVGVCRLWVGPSSKLNNYKKQNPVIWRFERMQSLLKSLIFKTISNHSLERGFPNWRFQTCWHCVMAFSVSFSQQLLKIFLRKIYKQVWCERSKVYLILRKIVTKKHLSFFWNLAKVISRNLKFCNLYSL